MLQVESPTPVPVPAPASSKGLPAGAIAGIAVGAGVGLALVLGMQIIRMCMSSGFRSQPQITNAVDLALLLGMWIKRTCVNVSCKLQSLNEMYMRNQPILAGQRLAQSLSVALSFAVGEGTAARCEMVLGCFSC